MPVLTCPKCPTKLKVPDGSSGNTRCPKCGTVFPVSAPPFEVVTAPQPKPKTTITPKLPPAKPQAAAAPDPDFEVVDEPKKKKPVDDDEDDEPRRKKRRDDDDEDDDDDRPRSRKRRSRDDDDDEDDDDRPRKKKKKKRGYDDDDDDDWQPRRGGAGNEFAKGKTGATLIGIAFWLNLAAYGLMALYALIFWLLVLGASTSSGTSRSSSSSSSGSGGADFLEVLVVLPGLLGLAAWIVGLVGTSIAIAGPRKSRGMAITATVIAAVHLILVAVTFSNLQDELGGFGRALPVVGKIAWIFVASTLPVLDSFLPTLFYASKGMGGDYVIALLAGVCEGARLLFMLFALKSLAAAARDYDAAERSGYSVMIVSAVLGGVALFALLVVLLLAEGGFKSLSTIGNISALSIFLMYTAYTLMMLMPAMAAMATRDACARRA